MSLNTSLKGTGQLQSQITSSDAVENLVCNDLIQQTQPSRASPEEKMLIDSEKLHNHNLANSTSATDEEEINEIGKNQRSQLKKTHVVSILVDGDKPQSKVIENTSLVQYWIANFSKYTGQSVAHWGSKSMVHEFRNDNPESYSEPPMLSMFDPQDYGFLIYNVLINNKSLVETYLNDNNLIEKYIFWKLKMRILSHTVSCMMCMKFCCLMTTALRLE